MVGRSVNVDFAASRLGDWHRSLLFGCFTVAVNTTACAAHEIAAHHSYRYHRVAATNLSPLPTAVHGTVDERANCLPRTFIRVSPLRELVLGDLHDLQ